MEPRRRQVAPARLEDINPCRRESKARRQRPTPSGWRTGRATGARGWSWANPVLIATPEAHVQAWRLKSTSSHLHLPGPADRRRYPTSPGAAQARLTVRLVDCKHERADASHTSGIVRRS